MNRGRAYPPSVVRVGDAGVGLARYLADNFPHADEANWAAKVRSGCVAVGEAVEQSPEAILREGAVVVYTRPGWEEPAVPTGWGTVLDDEAVLVLDKPSGLPCMPSEDYWENTVINLLKSRYFENIPSPAHRLGVGTSGLLLCPRTAAARRSIGAQFQRGQVEKTYLAEVAGVPAWPGGELAVTAAIGLVAHDSGWSSPAGGRCRGTVSRSGGGAGRPDTDGQVCVHC